MPERAQHAGGRGRHRGGLAGGLLPQDVRPHRHRLPLGKVRSPAYLPLGWTCRWPPPTRCAAPPAFSGAGMHPLFPSFPLPPPMSASSFAQQCGPTHPCPSPAPSVSHPPLLPCSPCNVAGPRGVPAVVASTGPACAALPRLSRQMRSHSRPAAVCPGGLTFGWLTGWLAGFAGPWFVTLSYVAAQV